MPCKACHKPKVKPEVADFFVEGNRYKGGWYESTYIVANIRGKYALINLSSGSSWNGLCEKPELEQERAHFRPVAGGK